MIRRSRAQSSSLFLMELIIAILFFAITSAFCVQFFVKSHLLSQESKILSQAVNECANIAEVYDTADSIREAFSLLEDIYPGISGGLDVSDTSAEATVYYDDSFSPCDREDSSYTLTAALTKEDSMLAATIRVTASDDSKVYELITRHHTARRTGYEK